LTAPAESGEKRLSRRRFIKWAGTSLAVGTSAVALGSAVLKPKAADGAPQPSNSFYIESSTSSSTTQGTTSPPTTSTTSATPSPAEPLSGDAFSIFWVTDTQFLSESNPALFKMVNNWIVDNWSRFNAKIVVHTGDLVQTGALIQEWINADDAMSILARNGIPYVWCAGNHDDLVPDDATSGWIGNTQAASLQPSVASQVVNKMPYARWVGDFHNGMNTAATFSASGLDFLVICVEWNGQSDTLQWVGSILDDPTYANYHVIMAPHAYINPVGSLDDPRWGEMLADFVAGLRTLMDAHSSNVFLSINGHFATETGYNTPQPVNGRNELMYDRQDCADNPGDQFGRNVDNPPDSDTDKVGGSTLMVLTFEPSYNQIKATTYDVYQGRWRSSPTEEYSVVMFPNAPQMLKIAAQ
jgi:hypothetical protein